MVDNNILGGRLSIEDGFTSPLDKFVNRILGVENRLKQFTNSVSSNTQKIATEGTKTYQQVDKIAARFVQQGDTVANAINKANDRVRQNQEKTVEGLSQKYTKLGMTIQQAYSKAQQDSSKIWNGDSSPNENSSSGNSDGLKDFVQSFLQSGVGGVIAKLGLIGAGITAGITVMKTLNDWMEQGFNILNKVSDGLFSYEGIKSAIEESMTFETGRMKLNLFTGSDEKGLEAYQNATYVAQKTYAGERDTVEISAKLAQLGINPSRDQLERLIDVAGTRPEVQTDHIGLAVKEAIEGRVMMMQMYGINNKNLQSYYNGLKKSDPSEYKSLKGSLNKEGTAGDPQKYFNLLTSYISKSRMNGYADKYADETMQGKIERMSGVWETLKGEIMGINVSKGIERKGGVFDAVGNMVDDLKKKLEDKSTLASLQKIGDAFGHVFTSISNAFTNTLKPETLDKVADSIVKIGEALAKMIDHFVDSGQLDALLDKLPALTEKVVGNEVINKTTDFKVGADIAQGNYGAAAFEKFKGTIDWAHNAIGSNFNEEGAMDDSWSNKLVYIMQGLAGTGSYNDMAHSGEDRFFLTDSNASTVLDKNSNLTDNQKNKLKAEISGDDVSTYNNVTIGTIIANDYNQIMKSIQEAAQNRK